MAELKNGQAFMLCTKCNFKNVVYNQDIPPKYCQQCGKKLQALISSAYCNPKAVDESVEKLVLENPLSETSNKPTTELPVDDKALNGKSCGAKPPNNKSTDSTMPSSEKSSDHKSLSEEPCGNKKSDDTDGNTNDGIDNKNVDKMVTGNQPPVTSDQPTSTNDQTLTARNQNLHVLVSCVCVCACACMCVCAQV